MNIYVGNLAYEVSEDDLRETFGQHGSVTSVNIIMNRETGRSKGFGFVEMENQAEGEEAIKSLDGKQIKGRAVRANEARPKTDKPRSDRGSW